MATDVGIAAIHGGGGSGSGSEIRPGDSTRKGRRFTEHAAERAGERGFDAQKIDNIIDNNARTRTKQIDPITGDVTWRYQDSRGNTVITSEWGDRIITVYSYPESLNSGHFIPRR